MSIKRGSIDMSKDATKPVKASKVDQIAGLRAKRFGATPRAAEPADEPEKPAKRPAKKKGKGAA
jgi:hypothetical protein